MRGDGDGDFPGVFAGDAGDADRAGEAGEGVGGDADTAQALLEAGALAGAADQAEVGESTVLQGGFDQAVVEVVAVADHQDVGVGIAGAQFRFRGAGVDRFDAVGQAVGELLGAWVDPAQGDAEAGQHFDHGATDVAGAEQQQPLARWQERFEQDGDHAAAALGEAGAERVTDKTIVEAGLVDRVGRDIVRARTSAECLGQSLACLSHGIGFQVAAADGAELFIGGDHHLGAGFAWNRSTGLGDGDQHAGYAPIAQFGQGRQPAVADVGHDRPDARTARSAGAGCGWVYC